MYLGLNIKHLRRSIGLSQTELGKRLNKEKATISNYERGNGVPSFDGLIKLAKIFDVSLDDLVFRNIAIEGRSPTGTDRLRPSNDDYTLTRLNKMLDHRVSELEREIKKHSPDLAKKLGI